MTVQVPERSKGLVLGTNVFALAGSNPVLYIEQTERSHAHSPFIYTFRGVEAVSTCATHVGSTQSYSVEVSTLDFDSSIPGSNPGRTTRFLHTFRGVKAVRNSCNSSRKFGKRPKSYEAAEVTLDGSGCRLQTCRRLVSQRFDSASTAPAPCASARAHERVHSRPGHLTIRRSQRAREV